MPFIHEKQNPIFSILPVPHSNNSAWGGVRTYVNRPVPAYPSLIIEKVWIPLRDGIKIQATLYAGSDAPDTDFIITLVDVYPNGYAQYRLE